MDKQALYTERLVSRSMLEMAFTSGRTNDGKEIKTDILKRPNSYRFGRFISSFDGAKDVSTPEAGRAMSPTS